MEEPLTTQEMNAEEFRRIAEDIERQVGQVIVGQRDLVRHTLVTLLAGGNALLEGVPGLGKTMLVRTLAQALECEFSRIQFTPDLMPADILGTNLIAEDEQGRRQFQFEKGPIFSNLVLADEINRATPKAQSALLEAMEEQQISIDGQTHLLPEPFFVIATQNPAQQLGTYPLPESQLDRFLMRISLGYPDAAAERALLAGSDRRALLARLEPQFNGERLRELQTTADSVHAAGPLLDYVQALLAVTRNHPQLRLGLSPRAGLGLLRAARGLALLRGRDYLVPEDVQAVFPAVAGHRLQAIDTDAALPDNMLQQLLDRVPLP